MNIKIQILVIVVVIMTMVMIVNMIRHKKLELKYALLWMLMGVGVFVFACFPNLTNALAEVLGIGTPINMLFFIGFCFALAIIFSLSTALSHLSNKVKKLTQEIALLHRELSEKENTK
jgi:Uncharacterized conserved protein